MTTTIRTGDRVAFSATFLKSLATPSTSPRWGDRGRVTHVESWGLATVRWDCSLESRVNVANLRCTDRGAGLVEETPMACGDAWNGMGFVRSRGD